MQLRNLFVANLISLTLAGCASLEGLRALIQPPRFEQASDRPSEIRLLPVQSGRAGGAATVRIWTNVTNPNPFGFTLSTVQATLLLDDVEAADADFPLGLPLQARQTETIPFDLTVSFANVPRLASIIRQAASGSGLRYRLEGTVGVDAGRFGQPMFGPLTLVSGDLRARF
jgi:LEA14-like dessication related protein